MSEVTFQMDERHLRLLEATAAREQISQDAVLARMLENLEDPAVESRGVGSELAEPVLTMREWMDKYCGIVEGTPPDYSTNPKYMEGFGLD